MALISHLIGTPTDVQASTAPSGSMDAPSWRERMCSVWGSVRPYVYIIAVQISLAGMIIFVKLALNDGMSPFVFVAYRHVLAALVIAPVAWFRERTAYSMMSWPVFFKIVAMGVFEPILDQNLYNIGMEHTSATFAATMCNLIPAMRLAMAWIFRLERVQLRKARSIAKVAGIFVSISGASIMTGYKGPLSLRKDHSDHGTKMTSAKGNNLSTGGSLLIVASTLSCSIFIILQAVTLRSYPFELTVLATMCLVGGVLGTVVALVAEHGNGAAWSLGWNSKLVAVVYSGVICSGVAWCLQGLVIRERGPVLVTAFSPLTMIIVAAVGFFILSENLTLGMIIGAVLILIGFYLVVWGKSKDPLEAAEV